MSDMAEKLRIAESGILERELEITNGRIVQDLSGFNWWMEHMSPGQGVEEGIHLLQSELSGNDWSWNNAHVPGDVYTDLEYAGEIEDIHFGRNMAKAKWVQNFEWWYNHKFNIPKEMQGKKLALVFEGVDYSCDVWMNTQYLGHHEGMMSSFKYDVTEIADCGFNHVPSNIVTVKLDPPPRNQKNFAGMKHNFSGDYLTGLIPMGIWKPVKVVATGEARIENYRVETALNGNDASVTVDVDVTGLSTTMLASTLQVTLKDNEGKSYAAKTDISIVEGANSGSVTLEIEEAKLWWPYELGNQDRYEIEVSLLQDDVYLDEVKGTVGLRQIKMEMNPGFTPDESEIPWTFVINGKKMFLRSACWGGQPSFFYGRNNREKYRYFLEKAKECNINNLRMFGWHPAEAEDFYDICDELGITVWTNFSFATQVFREDQEYLEKVYAEVAEIVKDRRNHPSTVMWMGGEEVFFSKAHVESGNSRLMKKLGQITNSLTNTPYADASPLSTAEAVQMGYKTKESFHANSHYYAAGKIFMEDYYPNLDFAIIPELTAASAPGVESLQKFIPEGEMWPPGPSWGYHAADMHTLEILNYEVFGDTKTRTVEEFSEATQIAQGTIFQFALEHFRRCKPHVSGVALCHFLTNWPIIKWDLVDYYGDVKKSYDFVKMCYQPLVPSLQYTKRRWMPGEEFVAGLWAINDYYKTYDDVTYSVEIINDKGEAVYADERVINIGENESIEHDRLSWVVKGVEDTYFDVKLTLSDANGEQLSYNEYRILIANQEKALLEADALNDKMSQDRFKYGRGYYRYSQDWVKLD